MAMDCCLLLQTQLTLIEYQPRHTPQQAERHLRAQGQKARGVVLGLAAAAQVVAGISQTI